MSAVQNDPRSDQDLIARVEEGDVGAFEILYWRHRDWVANLACRLTGDHALAMDVLQETFLYLLRKFPGFTLRCQLRSFLYPAVRNLSIAARRKAARNQSDELPELPWMPETPAGSFPDDLAAAVAALSEWQREVLLMRFVDELSLQEIAAALEIPLGTVKSRLHHALSALRQDERTKNCFKE